jgi:hypothetical protein
VVWYGWDGNEFEIFLWNGVSVQQLTDNNYQDYEPMIHNGQMVWTIDDASRNSSQIVFWDGASVEQLTCDYDTQNRHPQIHDGKVVWESSDGTDSEIFFWDGIKEGSLTVNIEPASARSLGARWRLDGGEWQDSGGTQSGIVVGVHFVEFNSIANFATPEVQTVNIKHNEPTTISQKYIAQSDSLTVNISPDEAVSAGAKWRVDEGPWQNSGDLVTDLDDGIHTVEFQTVANWATPESQVVTITEGDSTVAMGTYTESSNNRGDDSGDDGGGGGGCFIESMTGD